MDRRGITEFGLAPVDGHVPRDEAVRSVASRNTQYTHVQRKASIRRRTPDELMSR